MRSAHAVTIVVAVAGCVGAACAVGSGASANGYTDDEDAGPPLVPFGGFFGNTEPPLVVTPSNPIVFIDTATDPPTCGTQEFVVKADDADVSATAVFKLEDDTIGTFTGSVFTATQTTSLVRTAKLDVMNTDRSGVANVTVVALRRSGDDRDFFFISPYNAAPTPSTDELHFHANIQALDVAFVVDETSSMKNELDALKAQLTTIAGQLAVAIPSVGMSVVAHRDFPVAPYGSAIDYPFRVYLPTSIDANAVSDAVAQYTLGNGLDDPESQIPAMYYTLTGRGLAWGTGSVPPHTSPVGTHGGVDFRAGAVPVVMLVTDADWHEDYPFPSNSLLNLEGAFLAAGARFVGVTAAPDEIQPNALSDRSLSNLPPSAFTDGEGNRPAGCALTDCCTDIGGVGRIADGPAGDCRLNFRYDKTAPDLTSGIVTAVGALSRAAVFDVGARAVNAAGNPPGVDASKLVKALRAIDEGDAANGCPAQLAIDTDGDGIKDTFPGLTVGALVCFEVIPAVNTTVLPQDQAEFVTADVQVIGNPGTVVLDQRSVLFLIPPRDPATK